MNVHGSWAYKRLKHLVDRRTDKAAIDAGSRYVGLENVEPWTGKYIDTGALNEADSSLFQAGDVLFGKLRPYLAKVYPAQASGWCTSEMLVLRPRTGVLQEFLFYRLVSGDFIDRVNAATFGTKMPRADWEMIGNMPIAVPSAAEQRSVVSYLRGQISKIDDLIAKKQRLIELLDEKRAALISRAVTQGLDPSVPMKDSEVGWLGAVPAHWVNQALRHICSIKEGQVDPADERYLDWTLIAPNHVKSGTGEILSLESARDQAAISGKYLAKKGSVIYSKIRPALNKVCIAELDCLCSADMYPVYPNERVLNSFLKYRFLSVDFVTAMVNESMRVAMPKVNRSTFLSCRIPVPPIEEQGGIVNWIETGCSEIASITARSAEAVDLLREYRSALITAAVTGQLDIREHEKKLEALA